MKDLLSLRNVYAGYGDKLVIKNVSFDIPSGECCAILGLNGSGKTTLIKVICGLLPIKGGFCFVGGLDCTKLHEHKRAKHISYIPQRHSKLIGVSVTDTVAMGLNPKLKLLEFPAKQDMTYVAEMLEKFEIAHLSDEVFSELSEGQKQLVILARVLVQNAPVMLMDEPDSALDFNNRHKMLTRIRSLIKSEKKAGLVALHDPNLALAYCDRLILFSGGEIISDIHLEGANAAEIENCLAEIYGGITVFEHRGKYLCVKE